MNPRTVNPAAGVDASYFATKPFWCAADGRRFQPAGIRQLGRENLFACRIETGERRLDVIEFHWVCQALGQDTPTIYRHLIRSLCSPTDPSTPAPLPKGAESGVTCHVRD